MNAGDGTAALHDAVREEMPLAIGEVLAPLIHSAVRAEMRWWRRCAIAGYLVLVLGLGYVIHDNSERAKSAARDAERTTGALCALRHDLEERVAQTNKFLHDHPHGFAGIPAATLRNGEQGQIRTIEALSNLKCPPSK
jgi:hypothetical protein